MFGFIAALAIVWPSATKEMKPWAYNWWMGSAVDAAGLETQLDEMDINGMGGMHVIPIYSVKDNPNDKALLSSEWMDAFKTAVEKAHERGMGVDLTTGSGWCFGGPMLKPEEGVWMLEVNSKKLGDRKAGCEVLWRGEGRTLSVRPTKQAVKRSGPGGHGLMMNPLSPSAMASFLKPFAAAFAAPGAAKPEHMYHDSYEYFSAGWSKELPAAFAKRRGYKIEEHYAEMAGVGDRETIARVKCDYRETISDLMVEDVFSQWQAWANSRGMKTRNEAHGAPANLLDFYAMADIPETEMFSCDKTKAQWPTVSAAFMNSGDRDILISKFASSAAHVKHAGAPVDPLVSAETCTWVTEHFCETLGAVKTFVDRILLSGVNHMFYHGMCYSPADAKFPGWTFYATCEMNRFNPIWRDADMLNAYITRVQSIAQTTAIDNDVLVYWPIHDFWMDADGFEKQLTVHARDWFGGQNLGRISRQLYDDGYAFDFISEKQLREIGEKVRGGEGEKGSGYKAIVVPAARYMKVATLQRLYELADAGYRVVFAEKMPESVPGWKDHQAESAKLAALVREAEKHPNVVCGEAETLLDQAGVRREPFNKAAGLLYTRHQKDGVTYYFIANQYVDAGVKGVFKPNCAGASYTLMDPWSGKVGGGVEAEGGVEVEGEGVELELPIGHSIILAVSDKKDISTPKLENLKTRKLENFSFSSPWTRTPVAGGPEFPAEVTGRLPLPWGGKNSAFPESAFSGTMRYTTRFNIDFNSPFLSSNSNSLTLSLGKVRESAKIYLNGKLVGGLIMAPWQVEVPSGALKPGENELAIEVTSTGANHLKWLDTAKPYEWQIFTDINMVDIDYKKPFDASRWSQHEAGLYGPVEMIENSKTFQIEAK